MYCPKCGGEFQSWVKACPDCDQPLVPDPPPEPSHQAQELRCVLETSDPDVLPIATSALRAAGIPFWTPGETTMDLWPLGTGAGSGPSNLISTGILVPADRYEEARAILETRAEVVDRVEETDTDPNGGGEGKQ
jgi:hypothetical protein